MIRPTLHVPVLVDAVLDGMFSTEGGLIASEQSQAERRYELTDAAPRIYVDGTLGGAGHALRIAEHLREGDMLLGFDRDPAAIARVRTRLLDEFQYRLVAQEPDEILEKSGAPRWVLCNASYCRLPDTLEQLGISGVHGVFLDLGLSSDQLEDTERGFSFRADGPLDLRFDPGSGISAAEWLNTKSEQEIADAIYQYGEERFSRRIARAVVQMRRTERIESAQQFADLIHRSVPGRIHGRVDSATRTFQALRIVVNRELEHVEHAMQVLPDCLRMGGRLLVISFHSLEDRIVKHAMRNDPRLRVLTRKPIVATEHEISENPRSRSAKLRIAERLETEGESTP